MSATDELLPIPPQPEISEGNKVFHQKAYDLYKWLRVKHGPALIETVNLLRNAVTGAFTATSSTSMEITEGEKTLEISPGRSFMPGTPARIARTSDPSVYLDGITQAYDVVTGDFVFDGVTPNGSGTFTDWSISIIPSSGGGLASLFTNKFTGLQSFANEVTIASATTIDVTAAGSNQFKLTGDEVVEVITMPQGAVIKGRTSGSPTLKNSATLIVQGGADFICEPKDKLTLIKDGDGNVHVTVDRINGLTVANNVVNSTNDASLISNSLTKYVSPEWLNKKALIQQGAAIITTGAAAYDIDVPAGVKQFSLTFVGISTTGTSIPMAQLCTASGPEITGYQGAVDAAQSSIQLTSGFLLHRANSATLSYHGELAFKLHDSATNTWICNGQGALSNLAQTFDVSGSKALASELKKIRLTTFNGTDTYDAFNVVPHWEY
ncbi:MAG TPA: hypothetical protein VK958_06555 [Methylophilus sp.]|uniref:hypothetical protein n=1 Tax=Methylophilus sp. TaxID=29541 RepID=UPI002B60924C|nr:hypothetical protein [Methylophilus sp.]HSH86896.1 hypothetical protein [Methylophilus sp.]